MWVPLQFRAACAGVQTTPSFAYIMEKRSAETLV